MGMAICGQYCPNWSKSRLTLVKEGTSGRLKVSTRKKQGITQDKTFTEGA